MTLLLNAPDLEDLIDLPNTISEVRRAMRAMADGTAATSLGVPLSLPGDEVLLLPMAGLDGLRGTASVKLLRDHHSNGGEQRASQTSQILLVAPDTGELLAMLHGRVPTRVRTAAASAVASDALARHDAGTLGLIGAGALAVEHVLALGEVRPIREVLVWTRSAETRRRFHARLRERLPEAAPNIIDCPSVRDVCAASDILCTVTPSITPIVEGCWLRPGCHVNAVGARPRPEHRELDAAAMTAGTVVVDDRSTAEQKSGDLLLARRELGATRVPVAAELSEVLTGRHPGRTGRDEITVFDSVGIGLQDTVVARLMVQAAQERGRGQHYDLGS